MGKLLVLLAALFSSAAHAATIDKVGPMQTDPGTGCSLYLGGDIAPGDTEVLRTILDDEIARIDNYPAPNTDRQIVLCLESQGGSYAEGLDMALLVRERDVTTRLLPTGTCLSACAIVFMGGNLNTRSGEGSRSSRYMHPTSRLGFHAPALVLPEGAFDRDDVQAAYGVAIEATGRLLTEAQTLRFPLLLIENMFTHQGADFHYVDTIDDLALYGIDLYGYADPQLNDQSRIFACRNAWRWHAYRNRQPESLEAYLQYTSTHFHKDGGRFRFDPFDGWVWCEHEASRLGGGPMDHVVQSDMLSLETNEFIKDMVNTYQPSWGRLPGPSPLTALRDGNMRDF